MNDADADTTPRVFDGSQWHNVIPQNNNNHPSSLQQPVPPILHQSNDNIFVSIVSLRDGIRCGQTLHSLFTQAKHPETIYVGLVEQNARNDKECLVQYCHIHNTNPDSGKCPYIDQVRYLAVFDLGAQGPIPARAMQRKNLADEEYCMQIDAHSDFTAHWDQVVKSEWHNANNEYAILSTIPVPAREKSQYEAGGEKAHLVPRMCHAGFNEANLPWFRKPDGQAQNLQAPLLAHGWCAGFSFAKCHFEEAVPYDYFMPQIFDGEEFPRYARLWTRGYDVYTPTQNIVFHDDGKEPDGHEAKGWPKSDLLRRKSMNRIFTLLQMYGGESSVEAQANLGILGLGRRRSLEQFAEFAGVDLAQFSLMDADCANQKWVPYDAKAISAMDNLYNNPTNLDPQPEFPLRNPSSKQEKPPVVGAAHVLPISFKVPSLMRGASSTAAAPPNASTKTLQKAPSTTTSQGVNNTLLFFIWIMGIVVWYMVFAKHKAGKTGSGGGSNMKRKVKTKRTKKSSSSSTSAGSGSGAAGGGGGGSALDGASSSFKNV